MEQIPTINNGFQLLAYIIFIFATVVIPIIVNQRVQRKKINKIQEEAKIGTEASFKSIIEFFEKIEGKIEYLFESTKDSTYINDLQAKMTLSMVQVLNVKQNHNKEINDILRNATNELMKIIADIVKMKFSLNEKEMREFLFFPLRKIKHNVRLEKLEISNSKEFLESLQYQIIIPELDKFLLSYENIRKLENGNRKKQFEKSVMELLHNIMNETINAYNYEKRKIS